MQLALCAEPWQAPSTLGRKGTKQIAQQVIAEVVVAEPRAVEQGGPDTVSSAEWNQDPEVRQTGTHY